MRRAFNNVRLEDPFCAHCIGPRPMLRQSIEIGWYCKILTPSRCPVPSKCHQFQHSGGFVTHETFGGSAEIIGNRPLGQRYIVLQYSVL